MHASKFKPAAATAVALAALLALGACGKKVEDNRRDAGDHAIDFFDAFHPIDTFHLGQ